MGSGVLTKDTVIPQLRRPDGSHHRKKGNDDDEPLRVFDKSKYDASSKNINGFIRHLPAGQKASERAILIAESYGYELKSDETYVTPFVRRQWLKKKTEE